VIDLHSHTYESDGTCSPSELVDAAVDAGLEALAITDHDTFAGYDTAEPLAAVRGLELVCGIELNTRTTRQDGGRNRSWDVHVLGYFLNDPPPPDLRAWLTEMLESRRARNAELVKKLRANGVAIDLDEVEAIGRTLTGRPHFARVLVQKGYAANSEEAFRKYLGETAPTFVSRQNPETEEGLRRIRAAGGFPVLAHPIRLGFRHAGAEEHFIAELRDAGLRGLEAYHSDHQPQDAERYADLAKRLGLAITGGSDFHGAAKPHVRLGRGANGNLDVPRAVLEDLRRAARTAS
jgi:predicted metal-dependent phosphoesterase TrpH